MIKSTITYRWLTGSDLDILAPMLETKGWKPLNQDLSRAYCAFDGDTLVGFMVCQMVVHAGPLLINPEYRGDSIAENLAETMVGYVHSLDAGDLLVVPENKFSEALCKHFNLELVASPIYLMKR